MSSSFGLWCSCVCCLATSIRPLLIRRSGGQQLTEGRAVPVCDAICSGPRRGTRRSDESAAEGDAPGQNPAWLRDRAEKQFAGNRVLHPIPDTGVSPTGNDQHTTGIEEIVHVGSPEKATVEAADSAKLSPTRAIH
ncbi:unnamed protein product [Musa acuminata var. zebrina]